MSSAETSPIFDLPPKIATEEAVAMYLDSAKLERLKGLGLPIINELLAPSAEDSNSIVDLTIFRETRLKSLAEIKPLVTETPPLPVVKPVEVQKANTQFSEIFHVYRQPLHKYLTGMGLDSHTVEDLLQNIFVKVFEKIDSFQDTTGTGQGLNGWIYRIAHNEAMDEFRRGARIKQDYDLDIESGEIQHFDRSQPNPFADPLQVALDSETTSEARVILDRTVTPDQKSVIVAEFLGLSNQDIAKFVGISIGAVKSRKFRAKTSLGPVFATDFERESS